MDIAKHNLVLFLFGFDVLLMPLLKSSFRLQKYFSNNKNIENHTAHRILIFDWKFFFYNVEKHGLDARVWRTISQFQANGYLLSFWSGQNFDKHGLYSCFVDILAQNRFQKVLLAVPRIRSVIRSWHFKRRKSNANKWTTWGID